MLKAIEANARLRHAHMIGITPQIMKDGMCGDYREIQRISRPVYVNGTVVIDGCLGDFFTEKYASLEDTPVLIEIENGRP